jgi:hypothetical protein
MGYSEYSECGRVVKSCFRSCGSTREVPPHPLRVPLGVPVGTLVAILGTLAAIIGNLVAIIGTLVAIIGTLAAIIGNLVAIIGTLTAILGTLGVPVGSVPSERRRAPAASLGPYR